MQITAKAEKKNIYLPKRKGNEITSVDIVLEKSKKTGE